MSAVSRFGPPIALMGLIFFLSAQPHLSSGLGTWDLVGRKFVHATEYGLLFGLWWRALGWRRAQAPLIAAAIAIGYSTTDEFHQTFIAGRHGSPVDVLIDSTGVLIAFLLLRRRRFAGRATSVAT
jgi:VanZ family protein